MGNGRLQSAIILFPSEENDVSNYHFRSVQIILRLTNWEVAGWALSTAQLGNRGTIVHHSRAAQLLGKHRWASPRETKLSQWRLIIIYLYQCDVSCLVFHSMASSGQYLNHWPLVRVPHRISLPPLSSFIEQSSLLRRISRRRELY